MGRVTARPTPQETDPLSSPQKVNVVEQEKIDRLMIEMDGTENKCELLGAARAGRVDTWPSVFRAPYPPHLPRINPVWKPQEQ